MIPKALLEKAPEVYQAHYNIALALEQKGDWAGSAAALEKYVAQDPENAEAILKLATALDRSGETLPLYEKSASLDPENPITAFNLGLAMFQSGNNEQAASHFRRSLDLDATLADSHYMLGHVLLRQGDAAGARQSYEKFLELAPDSPNADAAREAVERLKNQ